MVRVRKEKNNRNEMRQYLSGEPNYVRRLDKALELRKAGWLNVGDLSAVLGTHPNTVRRWANEGLLHHRCSGSTRGDREFTRDQVLMFFRDRNMLGGEQ